MISARASGEPRGSMAESAAMGNAAYIKKSYANTPLSRADGGVFCDNGTGTESGKKGEMMLIFNKRVSSEGFNAVFKLEYSIPI